MQIITSFSSTAFVSSGCKWFISWSYYFLYLLIKIQQSNRYWINVEHVGHICEKSLESNISIFGNCALKKPTLPLYQRRKTRTYPWSKEKVVTKKKPLSPWKVISTLESHKEKLVPTKHITMYKVLFWRGKKFQEYLMMNLCKYTLYILFGIAHYGTGTVLILECRGLKLRYWSR